MHFAIDDEALAKRLGFSELRVGEQRGSPAGGQAAPVLQAWWKVDVIPSFAPSWAIGACYEEEFWSGDGAGLGPLTIRGFVADHDAAAVTPITADPVLDVLAVLNPFRITPPRREEYTIVGFGSAAKQWMELCSLDGIRYHVAWGTQAVNGGFYFSNPWAGWLLDFERVLNRFAEGVAAADERWSPHLDRWKKSLAPPDRSAGV